MSIYAYVGLTDGLFKLVMAYSLLYAGFKDNLIAYAVICASWQIILQLFYRWYCRKNFEESKLHIVKDKCIYKSMLSYSLWDLIGQFCATGNTQGVNLLINMFFGVTLNAASAISIQVTNAVKMLNNNFTTASNPQIVKLYAVGDYDRFFQLVFNVGKFSFFLIFILALPIALEAPYILSLWLKDVPDYSALFLRVALMLVLIRSFTASVVQGVHATGDVKFMNLTSGLFSLCLTLPGIYFFFKTGFPFWTMFIIQFFTTIVGDVMESISLWRNIRFSLKNFFLTVVLKPVCIALISAIIPLLLVISLPEGILRLTIVVLTSLFMSSVSIFYLGLVKEDRIKLLEILRKKISNHS
jgi:O-antigen/teichoic acid export membrane protein